MTFDAMLFPRFKKYLFSFFENFHLQTCTKCKTLEMETIFLGVGCSDSVCPAKSAAISYPHFPVRYDYRKNDN